MPEIALPKFRTDQIPMLPAATHVAGLASALWGERKIRLSDFASFVSGGDWSEVIAHVWNTYLYPVGGGEIVITEDITIKGYNELYCGAYAKLKISSPFNNRINIRRFNSDATVFPNFYIANMDMLLFEGLQFHGDADVSDGEDDFEDSVRLFELLGCANATFLNCQFHSLAARLNLIWTYETNLILDKTFFDGCHAAGDAVVKCTSYRGFSMINDSRFTDVSNIGANGANESTGKSYMHPSAWVLIETPDAEYAQGQRSVIFNAARFDEGANDAIIVNDARNVEMKAVEINQNGSETSVGIRLNNVFHAEISQSLVRTFTTPPYDCPGIVAEDCGALYLDDVHLSNKTNFLKLLGTTEKLAVRHSTLQGNGIYLDGIQNDAGATVSFDAEFSPAVLSYYLAQIAALAPSADDVLQFRSGEWTNRTIAQLKSDLAFNSDEIAEGSTNKFATAAEKTKLGFITVTQAVDLDQIETRVNDLDAAVVLKGSWSAASGVFPGGGAAQAGWSYLVTSAATVGGVEFQDGDRIIAILDNASTTVYAGNWYKADYTDRVNSVAGRTGNVVVTSADLADFAAEVKNTLSGLSLGFVNTGVGNTAGVETDLYSYNIPANTITANGQQLEFMIYGAFASNANADKRIRLKYGGTTVLDTGNLAHNGLLFTIRGCITYTGASAQVCNAEMIVQGGASGVYNVAAAINNAALAVFKVTGQGTGLNDVALFRMKVGKKF